MKELKRWIWLSVFCMSCALYAQDEKNVSWQFAFYDGDGTIIEAKSSSEPLSIQDGHQFRISLRSESDACCYVIDEQPDGMVCVLWNGGIKGGKSLDLPSDGQFFVPGPPDGSDRFHIIVSVERQKKLEKLLAASVKNGESSLCRQILDEVGRLRLAQIPFAEVPVKPAVMGASSRGFSVGSTHAATSCSGASVYVETIKIRH